MGSFFGPELVPLLSPCLPPFLPAGVKDSQLSLSSLLNNIPPSSGSFSSKAGSGTGIVTLAPFFPALPPDDHHHGTKTINGQKVSEVL